MATTHPELAAQLVSDDPTAVSAGTSRKFTWRCSWGHEWEAPSSNRIKGSGCPFCANQRVLPGFNDMATTRPELAAELLDADPSTVLASTTRKLNWRCSTCQHEWVASGDNRFRGRGCPVCAGRMVVAGKNDMATTHPAIAEELVGGNPTTLVAGTNRALRWRCSLGHEWTATGATRVSGRGCPYCSNKKVLPGFNDMATTHPELAAQLVGTDPTSVVAGAAKSMRWRCGRGHEWRAPGYQRVAGRGCPYCSNKKVLPGFNDMATTHPTLAVELVDTDPTTIVAGTNRMLRWRCQARGHEWRTSGNKRISGNGQNCPYCGNQAVLPGFNDLATTHPYLAAELISADPSIVMAGSEKKLLWRCPKGHEWRTSPSSRSQGRGCLYCSNQRVLPGFNDMATTHPALAAELVDTDPSTVIAGTHRNLSWRCPNHEELYATSGAAKVRGAGCPYCSNQALLPGFNDMNSTHPHLAAELVGTHPSTVFAGTHTRLTWKCADCGNTWGAAGYSRLSGSGCPNCAPYGFNPSKPAYLYLMSRHGEQQIGITVNIKQRQRQHARHGWTLLDYVGPMPGQDAYELELAVKAWLKDNPGTLPGTTENWSTAQLEVADLQELFDTSRASEANDGTQAT